MSEPIKRKRRTRTDSIKVELFLIAPTKSSPPPPATEVKSNDDSSNDSQITVDSVTTHQMTIDTATPYFVTHSFRNQRR